jgi:hypothetical protein
VTWIDDTHFAIANEGDMDGGTRGWTIFSQDGDVIYESGVSFEHAIIQIGHYPKNAPATRAWSPKARPSTCSMARPTCSSGRNAAPSSASTT